MPKALLEASPEQTRSLERVLLADAIESFNAAVLYRDRVDTAHRQINEISWRFIPKIEDAEEAVRKAKSSEPARLVARLVDVLAEPGSSPFEVTEKPEDEVRSLADAEAALSKVQADYAQTKADRDQLAKELGKAENHVEHARREVRSAVRAVVAAEGDIPCLIEHYHKLRDQAASMRDVLVNLSFAMPKSFNGRPSEPEDIPNVQRDSALAAKWRDALTALETDADAPLPELES